MSTYWYFECLSHDPPLVSDDEFTQHTDDSHFRHAIDMANNRPVGEWVDESDDPSRNYFDSNARRFLRGHPTCALGLFNEYGHRRPPELKTKEATK